MSLCKSCLYLLQHFVDQQKVWKSNKEWDDWKEENCMKTWQRVDRRAQRKSNKRGVLLISVSSFMVPPQSICLSVYSLRANRCLLSITALSESISLNVSVCVFCLLFVGTRLYVCNLLMSVCAYKNEEKLASTAIGKMTLKK